MSEMKVTDGTIYPAMRVAQIDVGELEIGGMAYVTSYPAEHINFCYEIAIRDASEDKTGWGKTIFQGSLKELIDLVKAEKKVYCPYVGSWREVVNAEHANSHHL